MSHREQEMTRRFLKHFFSILDAREQAAVGDSESERKDAAREESGTPLQVEQRAAIGNVLPQWVRLLCVQPHEQQQTPTANNNSNGAAAATAAGCESASYIEGDLGERWFALPHLALLPSPWTPRRPPPPNAARHRLLRHLQ
ncbi:hypothetical protein DQ04_18251000, partial [Trypanosoma grayi]|uniref:hypothetical protein n=1 Tax=Trypanosoma grayi TaxID=71804 RepID=UPI0004F498EA